MGKPRASLTDYARWETFKPDPIAAPRPKATAALAKVVGARQVSQTPLGGRRWALHRFSKNVNIASDMIVSVKIVIDTNVLVSALRSSMGPSFALMQAVRRGEIQMCCSPALFLEYEDVLKRPSQLAASRLSADDVEDILADLAGLVVPVATHYQWRPQLRDPSDEMVLEAAVNAGARAIATYNLRDFAPAANFDILVLNPEQTFKHFQLHKPDRQGPSP